MPAILVTSISVSLHVAQVNFGGKTDRVVEPVAKVPIGRMVENHRAHDDGSLQHQQRVIFCGKIVEQLGLGEEGLLRGREAGKAAGG